MKFVFWWDSPCKGMIGVLREFCRLEPDTVVLTGKTGKRREAMGWMNQPCLFPQHVIMDYQSAEEWNSVQCRELQKYSGCFHVVNGLVRKELSLQCQVGGVSWEEQGAAVILWLWLSRFYVLLQFSFFRFIGL